MSLVERALQKLQASRPAPAPRRETVAAPPEVAPRPLERVTARPSPPAPTKSPADLRAAPAKVLHIDRDRLRSLSMLPPSSQERELADQFRAIKRPLIDHALADAGDSGRRTIMVASALPGDGKTFTSLNLALSLALEKELHVLLVDCDAPKPHLTRTFELQQLPGVLDVLTDHSRPVESVIVPTDVPRLDFLPVGTWSETATELLASERMRDVVEQLAAIYSNGVILFDSPPILLTNESRALGALLAQIVLVVKAGVTPQQAVKDAVRILGEGRRVSLVLNNADLHGTAGYYYGYGYGYGAHRNET
jgi:protein-tyrosine kinase